MCFLEASACLAEDEKMVYKNIFLKNILQFSTLNPNPPSLSLSLSVFVWNLIFLKIYFVCFHIYPGTECRKKRRGDNRMNQSTM